MAGEHTEVDVAVLNTQMAHLKQSTDRIERAVENLGTKNDAAHSAMEARLNAIEVEVASAKTSAAGQQKEIDRSAKYSGGLVGGIVAGLALAVQHFWPKG